MRLCINEEKGKRISSLFCVCRFVALAMLQGAETAYPFDLQKREKESMLKDEELSQRKQW